MTSIAITLQRVWKKLWWMRWIGERTTLVGLLVIGRKSRAGITTVYVGWVPGEKLNYVHAFWPLLTSSLRPRNLPGLVFLHWYWFITDRPGVSSWLHTSFKSFMDTAKNVCVSRTAKNCWGYVLCCEMFHEIFPKVVPLRIVQGYSFESTPYTVNAGSKGRGFPKHIVGDIGHGYIVFWGIGICRAGWDPKTKWKAWSSASEQNICCSIWLRVESVNSCGKGEHAWRIQ